MCLFLPPETVHVTSVTEANRATQTSCVQIKYVIKSTFCSILRRSDIPPTSSQGPHGQQEEELKALLPLWQEDGAGHQLRVQVRARLLISSPPVRHSSPRRCRFLVESDLPSLCLSAHRSVSPVKHVRSSFCHQLFAAWKFELGSPPVPDSDATMCNTGINWVMSFMMCTHWCLYMKCVHIESNRKQCCSFYEWTDSRRGSPETLFLWLLIWWLIG